MFGNTITKFLKLDHLIENLTGFVETKVDLLKIEIKRDIAGGLARAIAYLLIAFVMAMVLLFISLGVAVVLGQKLGILWGYGIVGAFYLVVGIILISSRQTMIDSLEKKLTENLKKKK
jgi:hypothetical protein